MKTHIKTLPTTARRALALSPLCLLMPLLPGCALPAEGAADEGTEGVGHAASALSLNPTPIYDKSPNAEAGLFSECGKSVAQNGPYSLMSSFFDDPVTNAGGAYLYSGASLLQSFRLSEIKPGSCATSTTRLSEALTVTASSVENASYSAANVLDGQLGTRWSSAFSDDQWIMFQRPSGAPAILSKLVLNWEAAYATDYEVQLAQSTSGPWRSVYHQTNGKGGTEEILIPDNHYQVIRLKLNRRATAWGYSLLEVALHSPTPGCGIRAANGCSIDTFTNSRGSAVAMTQDWVAMAVDNLGGGACQEASVLLAKKNSSGSTPFGPITQYRIGLPAAPETVLSLQSLDVDGNTLAIAANGEVQVWEFQNSAWTQRWTVAYPAATSGESKRSAVALSGDHLVIGYPEHDPPTVLLANRVAGAWSTVGSVAGNTGSKFGRAVDVDGDRVAVGSASSVGVYRWGSSFATAEMLDGTQAAQSVAIKNNVVAVGRSSNDSGGIGDYARWYENVGGQWLNRGMPPRKLGISLQDAYGADDVDVWGNTVLLGSRNVESSAGAMFIYSFAPFATVQAEAYTSQSGTQLEATQDTGGGQNVGWIDAGDSLQYANLGNMPAGTYRIDYRVASQNGGGSLKLRRLSISSPTPIELGTTQIPSTGGWQSWTTVSQTFTTSGSNPTILEILATSGGWNLNWFQITQVN